jgi:hypothetical protein
MTTHLLYELKRRDSQRDNIPGEHWLTFITGIGLWIATRKHPSGAIRLLAGIAGGLLVARAASGTQIPERLEKLIPYAGSDPDTSPMPDRVT